MNIIRIIIYIGLAQGLLLGVVLHTIRRGNRTANRILGCILILFSAGLVLHTTCHDTEDVFVGHHKEIVMMLFIFTPVLFYYYVLTLTYGRLRFNSVHLTGPLSGIAVFGSHIFFNIILEELAVDILGTILFVMIFIYAFFSFRALFRYHKAIRNSFSSLEKINLTWLRNLLIAFLLSWVLTSVVEALKIEPITGDLIWLIVSVFIYWIGYLGLVQPEIFTGEMRDLLPDE